VACTVRGTFYIDAAAIKWESACPASLL